MDWEDEEEEKKRREETDGPENCVACVA